MKLLLYGGGGIRENQKLDRRLMSLTRKNPLMTLIPAASYESHLDFSSFVLQYKKFGVSDFLHFPIDRPIKETLLTLALSSDIIHLGGGNTFYFLHHLREKKLLPLLRKFVEHGGILTGLSAGAIMMSPDIFTASYPPFDCDENNLKMKNLKSLQLVDFDFFPHYENTPRYKKAMKEIVLLKKRNLYAAPNGSGIFYEDGKLEFIGDVYSFS